MRNEAKLESKGLQSDMKSQSIITRLMASASIGVLALGSFVTASAQDVSIILPGAPGEEVRELSADEAVKIAANSYTNDDVFFMTNMIPHHNQAVQMAALVGDRTNRKELVDIAGRIDGSQSDEIAFMSEWLEERGQEVPDPAAHMAMDMSHSMAGMASPAQMAELATLEGTEFDRMFLELMIRHHEGAVTMVENLLRQPGSAFDPVLFEFVGDIVNDQTAEINRMNELLSDLSEDARAGLSAGFRDAGEAIMNLRLVAAMPKPNGFFDPAYPSGLPPVKPKKEEETEAEAETPAEGEETSAEGEAAPERADDEQSTDGTEWGERSPLLSFSNTDMAFAGDVLAVGNYHGFNLYSLGDDGMPTLMSSVVCPGGQGDVSISGDLLIMSVEQTRGRVDCGLQGISEDVSEDRFRGLRIFDISDLRRPVQVGQVQTCRGSHTHSIVSEPDADGKLIVYNSGTSSIRDGEELEGCVGAGPGDSRTALFSIDVIEIPVDNPAASKIIDSPRVFADDETGEIAGLWLGGDHGENTQRTRRTDQCHDITVFPAANLAAGACSGNGIILDISDPRAPKRIDAVGDDGFAYWHSATFNNDGTKVLFTDEWGGGSRPRCRASDPITWGADAIYDIVDGKLEFQSYYKLKAPQSDQENCVAHNGAVVPVPGRDIFVQAWYQGGMSVIDFTDSSNPVEIAYFDRGPIHPERLVLGGYWSTYWYGGKIYGTEIQRGLDIFDLVPSDYLSANEIAAANLANQGETFNPQTQTQVSWPADPVVGMAYVDQLVRDGELKRPLRTNISRALERAKSRMEADRKDSGLANRLERLSAQLEGGETAAAKNRKLQLANLMAELAEGLR